jgi:hypothetical protein
MATKNTNTPDTGANFMPKAKPAKPVQAFEPFSWTRNDNKENAAEIAFYELTHDVTKGITLILDLVITSELDEGSANMGSECVPILASEGRHTLILLARAAAKMLRDRAEEAYDCPDNSAEAGHGS